MSQEKWTEGRKRSFITSAIRSSFRRWPPKFNVLKKACAGKKINSSSGRMAAHYTCALCNKDFPNKEVQVDHIDPVVPSSGFTTWDDFIKRLLCEEGGLQVLCKQCHALKTKYENSSRKRKNAKT